MHYAGQWGFGEGSVADFPGEPRLTVWGTTESRAHPNNKPPCAPRVRLKIHQITGFGATMWTSAPGIMKPSKALTPSLFVPSI